MLRNQLISALRNLRRHKLNSLINLSGFVICLVSLSLILLHVREETGYDSFHSQSERIYRITVDTYSPVTNEKFVNTGFMVAESLKEFPEVENATRIWNDYSRPISVVYEEKKFIEGHVYFTDTSFFEIFDVEMVIGEAKKALSKKDGLIISEEAARKYFGEEDPVGRVFNIVSNESAGNYIVTGVAKRYPRKSHFHFDFLASTESIDMYWKKRYTTEVVSTYLVIKEGTDIASFEEKIQSIVTLKMAEGIQRYTNLSYEDFLDAGYYYKLKLQPLKEIYLYSEFDFELEPVGSIAELQLIGTIGLFILILAIINYVNLSTAGATLRLKEIGIRSVLGSDRKSLVIGFLSESMILSGAGFVLTIMLTVVLIPWFNDFTGHSLTWIDVASLPNLTLMVALSLTLGILSGIYPSAVLSRVYPIEALKGTGKLTGRGYLRMLLVTIQFSVSLFLIVATLVVNEQLDLIQNKRLGFDRSNLLAVDRAMADLDKLRLFDGSLSSMPGIQNSSITSHIGQHVQISTGFNLIKNNPSTLTDLTIMKADGDYQAAMKINMVEGRWFSDDFRADSMSIILNRKAVEVLGLEDPLGTPIYGWLKTPFNIVGVVDDFHFESLHSDVKPLGILSTDLPWPVPFISYVLVRTSSDADYRNILANLEKSWNEIIGDRPFDFRFIDDHLNSLYEKERRTANIFQLFAAVSIFIAALGLFGLITFIVNRRLKEIGIRKVLGAGIFSLYRLLSMSLTKPIFISILITFPLSFFAMEKWLDEFAYRISPGAGIPLLSALAICILVALSISYSVIKAGLTNPAEILRDE